MKRIGIYVRVSTSRQDKEGHSIPMQKARLIAYCKAKGWVVAGFYSDPGHSGSTIERPGMTLLIEDVSAGKLDAVLVYKLDRLSRSQKDTLYLIEDVLLANGVDFVSLQESFDTSTIYGRAMIGILSVFAQMERETIAERTLSGRAGRAELGLWHGGGTAPIGYDYIDGLLVVNREEAAQVQAVYNLYAAGFSLAEISRRMEGYTTKHGDWSHTSTIANVLDNPLYAGTVHFDGVTSKGRHTPIVDREVDARVKARREGVRRAEAAGDSEYMLTSLVRCGACGARYFANKRPNGKVVYSCHSRAKKNKKMVKDPNCTAPHYPISELDAMVEAKVLHLAENPQRVHELIKKRADPKVGPIAAHKPVDVQRLDAEIGSLMDLLQHDALASVEDIARKIAEKHAERTNLSASTVRDVVPRQFDVDAAKSVLRDVQHNWSMLDSRGRRAHLFQLIDGIQVDAGGIRIMWSFV